MMQPIERESMNFRLPKPLAEALRNAASSQPGKTATDIVIRALIQELGDIQGVEVSTETRLKKVEKSVQQLADSIKKQAVTSHLIRTTKQEDHLKFSPLTSKS
ncbi:MAG: hypothetical protein AAFX46_17305 [Cyanobacteria bacterium J06636_27]